MRHVDKQGVDHLKITEVTYQLNIDNVKFNFNGLHYGDLSVNINYLLNNNCQKVNAELDERLQTEMARIVKKIGNHFFYNIHLINCLLHDYMKQSIKYLL